MFVVELIKLQFKIIILFLYAFFFAARPVPEGEMFTRRWASFPVPIRYVCQFISFQYIIIRVRQAKLKHYG